MADFGTDAMCVDDMDMLDRTVSQEMVLAQDLVHALKNRRGRFIAAPDAGTNIADNLSLGMTDQELREAAVRARAECEDDERVASVTAAFVVDGERLDLALEIAPIDGEPFDFVVEDFLGVTRIVMQGGAGG